MANKALVNSVTLSRIVLSIIFAFYIRKCPNCIYVVIVLYAAICISDLYDGKLARKFSISSKSGAVMDVTADLFFIISACVVLLARDAFPLWMFTVMICKFLEFLCTSRLAISADKNVFLFDKLGRMVAVIFYVLPFIAVILEFFLTRETTFFVINIICIPPALGAAISSLHRIKACIQ